MPSTAPPPVSRPRPSAPAPRPSNAPPPVSPIGKLDLTPRKAKPPCPFFLFYATPGFGKTTFGAHAPSPLLLMARGEQGYDNLLAGGLVPSIPALIMESYDQTIATVDQVLADPQGIKTVVFDGLGSYERMCQELVCQRDFNGEWGERGFGSYQKGFELSVGEWLKLLQRITRLRTLHGITVVMLGHSRIKTFNNPLGANYDKFECDVHAKIWAATSREATDLIFGKFFTIVDVEKKQKKGKGIGGGERVLYTENRDAFDAKSTSGLPPEIWLEGGPANSWNQVWSLLGTHKPEAPQ